jgi:hypothetical protein
MQLLEPLRVLVSVFALGSMLACPAQAYQQQLTSEAIREAYFLGSRNDEITLDFWNHYERVFTKPSAGLCVGGVEILTPYAQVVYQAQHFMTNETAVDAVQEYAHLQLPFIVRVSIDYPNNALPTKYDVEKDSSVSVWQGHRLRPKRTSYRPMYVSVQSGKETATRTTGIQVELEFDTSQVASADLTVCVSFSEGRHFETAFDLDRLK